MIVPRGQRRWEVGRQGTGYWKMLLCQGSWWDLWLLKFPRGTMIPPHRDPAPGKRHYRLNIVLRGDQDYRGDAIFRLGPVVFFRPDITTHEVRRVQRERVVLSLGWVR